MRVVLTNSSINNKLNQMDNSMDNSKVITEIVDKLGQRKGDFLNNVESSIHDHIQNQSIKKCLTFVERNNDGSVYVTWEPNEIGDGYVACLVAFCRKKTYRGKALDSALTDPIVKLVTSEFEKFYLDSKNNEIIAKALMKQMFNDRIFLKSFSENIAESTNSTLPSAMKTKLVALLINRLEDTFNTHIVSTTSDTISHLTTKIVASATAVPITKTLAMLITKHFAVFLKGAIVKVLGSAAIKSMLATAVKKLVAAKVIAIIVALVGSKLGISAGAAFAFILIPLIIAFIAREVYILPRKLAEKVSREVKEELSGEFKEINNKIINQIINDIALTSASAFAGEVANDHAMKETIRQLLKEI